MNATTAELLKKQEELEKKARELERRERELQSHNLGPGACKSGSIEEGSGGVDIGLKRQITPKLKVYFVVVLLSIQIDLVRVAGFWRDQL